MAILKKLKKGLKKAAKVAIPVGAALLAARAMKRRGEMKDFLATEGGNKSDMRSYGPFSKGNNFSPKRSNASIAGDFINKINDKTTAESGMQFYDPAVKLTGRTRSPLKADNSGIIRQYKSGGKVKGCGKALRGFGKAMKKGKR